MSDGVTFNQRRRSHEAVGVTFKQLLATLAGGGIVVTGGMVTFVKDMVVDQIVWEVEQGPAFKEVKSDIEELQPVLDLFRYRAKLCKDGHATADQCLGLEFVESHHHRRSPVTVLLNDPNAERLRRERDARLGLTEGGPP